MDPFAQAMRHIEFESGRLMQAQIIFLKSPQFHHVRDEVAAAVERRHEQMREHLSSMLLGLEVETSGRHLIPTAYHLHVKAAMDAAAAAASAAAAAAASQAGETSEADQAIVANIAQSICYAFPTMEFSDRGVGYRMITVPEMAAETLGSYLSAQLNSSICIDGSRPDRAYSVARTALS